MSEKKLVKVEFAKNCSPYKEGDIAGVSAEEAKRLEELGVLKGKGEKAAEGPQENKAAEAENKK